MMVHWCDNNNSNNATLNASETSTDRCVVKQLLDLQDSGIKCIMHEAMPACQLSWWHQPLTSAQPLQMHSRHWLLLSS